MGLNRDPVSTDDERKAATKAQAVLSSLVPSTAELTDETIFALRHAARIAATAIRIICSFRTIQRAMQLRCDDKEDNEHRSGLGLFQGS
jgi:hypothetical protein